MSVKTGQQVKVIAGKNKGKTGKVLQVLPSLNKVVVDGVNKMFKHFKNRQSAEGKGDRLEFFGPIDLSNVQVIEEAAIKEQKPKSSKKPASKKS